MRAMIPSPRQSAADPGPTGKPPVRLGRDFVARHGETVFNAAHRLQGDAAHTPLTRAGFAQADELGRALRDRLGAKPPLTLWASPTGRALQTLAVVAEHLELDWHAARTDARLVEIDMDHGAGAIMPISRPRSARSSSPAARYAPRPTAKPIRRSPRASAAGWPIPPRIRATGW